VHRSLGFEVRVSYFSGFESASSSGNGGVNFRSFSSEMEHWVRWKCNNCVLLRRGHSHLGSRMSVVVSQRIKKLSLLVVELTTRADISPSAGTGKP
jgi:hypothetical protein